MNEFSTRRYNDDDVSRIIRRALKLKNEDTISHEDLIDTAREVGLDPQILEAAIEHEQKEFKKERIRTARLRHRKAGFYRHLWSYLIVNGGLFLIDSFTPGPWWFQWSVIGWGIAVAFHFKATFFHAEKRLAKGSKTRTAHRHPMVCQE